MPGNREFSVDEKHAGLRVDVFLTRQVPGWSRSRIKKLLQEEAVTVNGEPPRAGYKLRAGDSVILQEPRPGEFRVEPEAIPLDIYYQDSDVVVVNKPRGMVVHPAAGNWEGTLVNALLYHFPGLDTGNGDNTRPGIVHRLDKDTSGLLMVAKNETARKNLVHQLKERKVARRYLALVHGSLGTARGKIDAPIGRHPVDRKRMAVVDNNSREAVTRFAVLERNTDFTLLDLQLETGRTHQIRVHMAYINHPVVGDERYGPRKNRFGLEGQFLHAYRLGFIHPSRDEYMEFNAPLPVELREVLARAGLKEPPVEGVEQN